MNHIPSDAQWLCYPVKMTVKIFVPNDVTDQMFPNELVKYWQSMKKTLNYIAVLAKEALDRNKTKVRKQRGSEACILCEWMFKCTQA